MFAVTPPASTASSPSNFTRVELNSSASLARWNHARTSVTSVCSSILLDNVHWRQLGWWQRTKGKNEWCISKLLLLHSRRISFLAIHYFWLCCCCLKWLFAYCSRAIIMITRKEALPNNSSSDGEFINSDCSSMKPRRMLVLLALFIFAFEERTLWMMFFHGFNERAMLNCWDPLEWSSKEKRRWMPVEWRRTCTPR